MGAEQPSSAPGSPGDPDSNAVPAAESAESGSAPPPAGPSHTPTHPAPGAVAAPKTEDGARPGAGARPGNIYTDKQRGKELYEAGDLDGAIEMWSASIKSLSFILNKARHPDDGVALESLEEYTGLYVSLCLNLSLAHLKKGEFAKCKEYCQYVLMYDARSLKAHLRIVQADLQLQNFQQALANCERGIELNPGEPELLRLRASVLERRAQHERREKELFRGVFQRLDHDPRSEEDLLRQMTSSRYYKFSYALFTFYHRLWQLLKRVWRVLTFGLVLAKDSVDRSFLLVERCVESAHLAFSRAFHSLRLKLKSS